MPNQELANPPIIESVFFVRFKDQIDKEAIISFCQSGFTQSKYDINNPSFRHSEPKEAGEFLQGKQYGRVLRATTTGKVLRVNVDSISFHCLSYKPFESLYEEFSQIVNQLLEYTPPPCIDKVSLRYINLIKVDPLQLETLPVENYVSTYIESPLVLHNYFLQINVSDDDDKQNQGVITQTLKPAEDQLSIEGIVVDIQVQRDTNFPYEENISRLHFFSLREYKNHLFFSTIKPNILDTYR